MRPSVLRLSIVLLATSCTLAVAQEVTLPLDRYDQLRKEAAPTPPVTPPPVVPITLDRAWLEIDATADGARLSQKLTVTLLADGWQEVALPRTGSYLSADLGGLEGRLSDGRLIVRGRGRHEITLQSMLRLTADDSSARPLWSLSVPLPNAAVVAGTVHTPPAMSETVVVSGGVARDRTADGDQLFAGIPGQTLLLNFLGARRGPEHSSLPLRFSATSATLAQLAHTRHRLSAELVVRISQGEMRELRVGVPAGYEVVDASGELLAGWDMTDGALVLSMADPVRTSFTAHIDLSGPPAASFASPLVTPLDAESTAYASGLSVDGDGLLELGDRASARFAGAGEGSWLPAEWKRRGVAAVIVADPASPPVWTLEWASRSEVLAAQIDRMVVDVLAGSGGQAAYQLWLAVRSSGAAVLHVQAPPGLRLTAASRDGVDVLPGHDAEGLVFPLAARSQVQVIHLAALLPMTVPDEGELSVPLPVLSAPVSRVETRVTLPPGHSYTLESAAHAGRVSAPPQAEPVSEGGTLATALALDRSSQSGDADQRFFPVPSGFVVVEAAWSAMAADPSPVKIQVSSDRVKREWF